MADHRTAVGIVGAGPAGLLLGHLLQQAGIDSVTVEIRSEQRVIDRVRAGVLEQTTVDLLHEVGLGERLAREGMRHEGLYLSFGGTRHRVDLAGLTGGRAITVYGQNEVVRDLITARRRDRGDVRFDVERVELSDLESDRPRLLVRAAGKTDVIRCDYIAGCDGFHGVSPNGHPRHGDSDLRPPLPVRVARHPGAGRALFTRARLLSARNTASRSSACDRQA